MQELTKGANAPVLADAVRVRVSWSTGPTVPDVDVSALLCGASGNVSGDHDFVFFNQTTHPSGSVRHVGKATAGGAAADMLEVDLGRVPGQVEKVVIAASADSGTFGQIPGLAVEVLDGRTGQPLLRFAMAAATETALLAGELYRRAGAWKFRAIAQGYNDGLAGLARDFGITVDDDPAPSAGAAAIPQPSPQPSPSGGGLDWLNPPVPAGYEN